MIDKDGLKWIATITIGKVKMIKHDIDYDIFDFEALEEINDQDFLDMMWILYSDSNPTIPRLDWEESLHLGDECLGKAVQDDFIKALHLFFPDPSSIKKEKKKDKEQFKDEPLTLDGAYKIAGQAGIGHPDSWSLRELYLYAKGRAEVEKEHMKGMKTRGSGGSKKTHDSTTPLDVISLKAFAKKCGAKVPD